MNNDLEESMPQYTLRVDNQTMRRYAFGQAMPEQPQPRARPADELLAELDRRWSVELEAMMRECYEAEVAQFTETDQLVQVQPQAPIGMLVTREGAVVPITLTTLNQRIAQKRAFGGE